MSGSNPPEVWFVTGSQHLYGPEVLDRVAEDSRRIVEELDGSGRLAGRVVFQAVLTTSDQIARILGEADRSPACVGVIAWMHTFSPARMWIGGLRALEKPLCHLHTQFDRSIPWSTIDMDHMNLHQSAHGDREFGHLCARLRINRKVVAGHWRDPAVQDRLDAWIRAATAWHDARSLKVARFGDNMRRVAVTEGDKVEAEIRLGFAVDGYGVGELVRRVEAVDAGRVDALVEEYQDLYAVAESLRPGGDRHASLREAARIEAGLRDFMEEGGFGAFTDTFEDLVGLTQLPGLAVQRLMADGYGFGAEGDWKHAALVRAMKVMARGRPGGTSFMEDYTYHLEPGATAVLGAHMLEICPSIAASKPSCEVHPLAIGGKDDPVRLVFDAAAGPAVNASIVDLGDRFRMVVNVVDVVETPEPLPRLPVARALWRPRPDFETATEGWIHAGGAHHTGFSRALGPEHLEDFAAMADIEFLLIDEHTDLRGFRNEIRWNDAAR